MNNREKIDQGQRNQNPPNTELRDLRNYNKTTNISCHLNLARKDKEIGIERKTYWLRKS